ncbi:hypothetical protein ACWGKQ_32585 [Streptomyces sp. NPDC054770]
MTGANRGLGQVAARLLLQHGAQRVYGGARDPRSVVEPAWALTNGIRGELHDAGVLADERTRQAKAALGLAPGTAASARHP